MRALALITVILAISLTTPACAQVTTSGTFGTGVAVKANEATTINFNAGITSLVITVDSDATVTLSILVSTAFTLDPTLSQYTLGALASATTSIGYSLDVSAGSITSASITSDTLAASFVAALTGNVAGILYYNANTASYLEITPTIAGAIDKKATFSAPYKGSYAFVFRASTQPLAALFANAMAVAANVQSKLQYHSSSTAKLVVTQTTTADSQFTARESASAPSGVNANIEGHVRISNYYDLSSTVSSGISNQLQYYYSAADEAKVDTVQSLKWFYYNTATNTWDVDGTSTVDVNARVVTHASTHFSTWTVAGESAGALALPALAVVMLALLVTLLA